MRHAFLLLVATVLLAAWPAIAQSNLTGLNLAPPPPALPAAPVASPLPANAPAVAGIDERIAFNSTERWLIPHYFQRVREQQRRAARAKKFQRALPDGVATPPQKGDMLPLGVVASLHRLPAPLARDLPPERPDTNRLVVGTDIVMLRSSTGEVLDVLNRVIE